MNKWLEQAKAVINFEPTSPELPQMPGEERSWQWGDFKIVYSLAGAGKPVLLLHGVNASAWRFEVRRNIEPLAAGGYKVYAPDMPGFGKSTRLPRPYTADEYISFIKDFAGQIKDWENQPVRLIANSLVATHAIAAAAQAPELFASVVLISPAGITKLAHGPTSGQRRTFQFLNNWFGQALFNLLTSRPSTNLFLSRDGYYNKNYITPAIVEGYHRAARYSNARYAPFSFITFYLGYNVKEDWVKLKKPAAIFWGEEAKTLPPSDLADFVQLRPATETHVISKASLAVNDERADEFNHLVLETLQRFDEQAENEASPAA